MRTSSLVVEPSPGASQLRDRPGLAAALDMVRAELADRLPQPPGRPAPPAPALRLRRAAGGRLGLFDDRGRAVRGKLPRASPPPAAAGPLYAIGDVHGRYDLLASLLPMLANDAEGGGRRPTVVFLGDYIDRAGDPAAVLEALCWLKEWGGVHLHLLKGNHEQALLRFLDSPEEGAVWCGFGGAETLRAYGVEPPEQGEPPSAWTAARDLLLRRLPAAHLRLLQDLDLMVVIGGYAFVHAGVAPGAPLARQDEADLLWIRDEFLETRRLFERTIVHGHSWVDDLPVLSAGRIGLDTGAYATGVLTAARLGAGRIEVLQAKDPSRPAWPRTRRSPAADRVIPRPADYAVPMEPLRIDETVSGPALWRPSERDAPAAPRFETVEWS